jgi:hypothetical protein
MKNVLRSVTSDSLFTSNELEQLFFVFKEEYLMACYWRANQPPTDVFDKYDPCKPYYEQYKVEFDQFRVLFCALSPWTSYRHSDILALHVFRLLDTNHDNMVNFREFIWFMSIVCRAELQERLKLLYRLHQPPALLDTELIDSDMPSTHSDTADSAVEAVEYFDEQRTDRVPNSVTSNRATAVLDESSEQLLQQAQTSAKSEAMTGSHSAKSETVTNSPSAKSSETVTGSPSAKYETATGSPSAKSETVSNSPSAKSSETVTGSPSAKSETMTVSASAKSSETLTGSASAKSETLSPTQIPHPSQTSPVADHLVLQALSPTEMSSPAEMREMSVPGDVCSEHSLVSPAAADPFSDSSDNCSVESSSNQRRNRFKNLAAMNQGQFIQMCKTMYNLFTDEPNEQELFHSIATVATLLLQIGEVGKQFYAASVTSSAVAASGDMQPGAVQQQQRPDSLKVDSLLDTDWSITFEQLLASMLTESALVNYFECCVDLMPAIERFRNRRLQRQASSPPTTADH